MEMDIGHPISFGGFCAGKVNWMLFPLSVGSRGGNRGETSFTFPSEREKFINESHPLT